MTAVSRFWAALWLCLIAATSGHAADMRIAAVVNDDVISVKDLSERLRLVMLTSQIPDSEEARARLAPQVLRGLIEETLQVAEAKRLSLDVSQAEVDQALASIAERNKMSVPQMQEFMAKNQVDLKTLQDQLRAQIAWLKVVAREIRPKVTVSVDQLDLAVQEARGSQGQPEYLLSEIVLPADNPGQEATVAKDAGRLYQTLREGASFEALARQVSAAASASNGGDLGWVKGSSIPPELVGALERLRPGEVSEPLRSSVGFHLFLVRDRRIGQSTKARSDEVRLAQILFPAEGASASELAALGEKANGLRDRLSDCGAVAQVAAELDAPASGDLGWLKLGDLPAGLSEAVATLPAGEISQPLRGPAGIHLLMVCERRTPDGPAVDREQLTKRLEQERIERLARRYLRDLRKDAFVDVRL